MPWMKKKDEWWSYYCLGTSFSSKRGSGAIVGSGCLVPLKSGRRFCMSSQSIFPTLCAPSNDQETNTNQRNFQGSDPLPFKVLQFSLVFTKMKDTWHIKHLKVKKNATSKHYLSPSYPPLSLSSNLHSQTHLPCTTTILANGWQGAIEIVSETPPTDTHGNKQQCYLGFAATVLLLFVFLKGNGCFVGTNHSWDILLCGFEKKRRGSSVRKERNLPIYKISISIF